jgi:hypothetical protein
MTLDSKSIVKTCVGILVASVTAAAAETTGTMQVALDADLRPPGEVEPAAAVRPAPRPALVHRHINDVQLWGGGVRLTGLSGVGALPGVNMGAELAVYVRRDERFLELGYGHWIPQETYVVAESPERVELALDVWTVRGGWASTSMPLRAWVLAEVGELAGTHQVTGAIARMVGAVEKERRWVAAGGGVGVAWPMTETARLVGTVELAIPIDRTPMMMQTGSEFEPDPAAARANLGLEIGWR